MYVRQARRIFVLLELLLFIFAEGSWFLNRLSLAVNWRGSQCVCLQESIIM